MGTAMGLGIGRFGLSIAGIAAMAMLFAAAAMTSAAIGETPGAGRGPLDGMIFVGKIGPEGKPDFDEELHFNNGHFWSKNCIVCGYQPSVYWVRTVGESIHFHGELLSDSGSRFRYTGRVTGDRIKVTVRWTKSRWYWSIDRTLIFEGARELTRNAVSVGDATKLAISARQQPLPRWCT